MRIVRQPIDAQAPPPIVATDELAALADAALRQQADAMRTLIVTVAPAILRAVRSVLGTRHPDVEDVAQEAALGFARALPEFRRECNLIHFACRIGVLGALAARRRLRARAEDRVDDGFALDLVQDGSASPIDAAIEARRRAALRDLCDDLPDGQREALVMHVVLGMTVEETAAACRVPANTVRSRLRLAKEALRARIQADVRLRDAL